MSKPKRPTYLGGSAKLLSGHKINSIVNMIGKWETKLTWDLLVERIKSDLGISITRQSLSTYELIASAYSAQKNKLRLGKKGWLEEIELIGEFKPTRKSTSKQVCVKCIEKQKEIERLKAQIKSDNEIKEAQLEFIQRLYDNIVKLYPNTVDLDLISQPLEKPSYQ